MSKLKLDYLIKENTTINSFMSSIGFSSQNIYQEIKENNVYIDDILVKTKNDILSLNDHLTIYLNEEINTLLPNKNDISIVYEDDYLLVINKPYNLEIEPSRFNQTNNLASSITNYFNNNNIHSKIHLVNRLDKLTIGLVIVAKNRYIKNLFSKIDIEKRYLALVEGHIEQEGRITINIEKDGNSVKRKVTTTSGKNCITNYKLVEYKGENSLVQISIPTGRTHQIRVSFAHIGHPLINDPLYNKNAAINGVMYLKAYYLRFIHPITNRIVELEIN